MERVRITYTDGEVFVVDDVVDTEADDSTYVIKSDDGTFYVIPKVNVKRIIVEDVADVPDQ